MNCDWQPISFAPTPGLVSYRCRRCGKVIRSPFALDKIGPRRCGALRLAELERRCAACETVRAELNRRIPRAGDTLAAAIDLVTRGRGQRLGHWLRGGPRILLRWPHGLGDAVQGTVLVKHLRHYFPHWKIHCAAKLGQSTAFDGLADRTFRFEIVDNLWRWIDPMPDERRYEVANTLDWWDPQETYPDSPATKAERSLREVFGLAPIEKLCRYEIRPAREARRLVARHAPAGSFACVHYQGNTGPAEKSINEHAIREVLNVLISRGITPVILDWERPPRSGLIGLPGVLHFPNGHPIWGAEGAPSAACIAALCARAVFNFGIDSGPGHIMGAVDVPTIIAWVRHHPLHYYCLAPNVLHVVPPGHEAALWGDREQGLRYFRAKYRHYVTSRNYRIELPDAVAAVLDSCDWDQRWLYAPPPEFVHEAGHWIRSRWRDNDLGIVREVHEGDDYRVAELPDDVRTIIDVGAHIGAFATKARQRWPGCEIACVEANPRNVRCLELNAPFARIFTAAASYEPGPLLLLNSVFEGASAGPSDSEVVPASDPRSRLSSDPNRHRAEELTEALTIEEILRRLGWPLLDILKLDCEGGEWSILENLPFETLSRIRLVVGEYHRGRARLEDLAARRFPGWDLRIISSKLPAWDDGGFWLVNRALR